MYFSDVKKVTVIGAGLAGSEAALQIASRGISVDLYEMRPGKTTPAHKTDRFAELVCSNSLKSLQLEAAHGLLKEELRLLGSYLLRIAEESSVKAGQSLAVDREVFSTKVTAEIEKNPNIRVVRKEAEVMPDENQFTVLAAGPLISSSLSNDLMGLVGEKHLSFFDAVAPIVSSSSLDMNKILAGSRYGKGDPDFLNCFMNKEQYLEFHQALTGAEEHPLEDFEDPRYFESCLPVEVLAKRGPRTLVFGTLRPVGFTNPETGRRPYAVVQLRNEDSGGKMMNLVGFQTRLKIKEQERVFRMIPGLENAEFLRYGKMHRNTFVCAPRVLDPYLRIKKRPNIISAGQITGSEGYTEAIATGLLAGMNAVKMVKGLSPEVPPEQTAVGALVRHLIEAEPKNFQPMNFNFGLMPELAERIKAKKERRRAYAERALEAMKKFIMDNGQ